MEPSVSPHSALGYSQARLVGDTDLEKGNTSAPIKQLQDEPKPGVCLAHEFITKPDLVRVRNDDRGGSFASSAPTLLSQDQDNNLPKQKYTNPLRWLRWKVMSIYRRLNILVIAANVLAMIILGAQGRLLTMSPSGASAAVAANLTAAILVRQELVVNLLFVLFGCCPQWMPLRIRRLSAKIYHLGGTHSGAGIAAVIWFAVFNVIVFRTVDDTVVEGLQAALITITLALDALLVSIVVSSHPRVRARYHNIWEAMHRFAGWTAVALFWAEFGIMANAGREMDHPEWSITEMLIRNPNFWLLLVVTISLIMPWLRLRKVKVNAEHLSDHAVRLHFDYTNLPLCAGPRFSDAPLKEWHSFAGIPEEDGYGFSILVSKAGDWTTKIIRNPPTKLWTRGTPVRGVLHVAPIFKKIVLVATGSGIGPVMSLLYARNIPCRIFWSTPDPEKRFKKDIINRVRMADPDAVIYNTRVHGRPNLTEEAYRLYAESGAEAVFIISNPGGTYSTVYELESRGVPAFAPIFDS